MGAEAVTDEQLDKLMRLAARGDSDAQQMIDAWIARALSPLCATPLAEEVTWLNDEPECCGICSGEEPLAA